MTSSTTASTVGAASTVVIGNGRIVGLHMSASHQSGAGSGSFIAEVALNNTTISNANSAAGAPSEQLIGRISVAGFANGCGNNSTFVPLNIPVRQGNVLCINNSFFGTAPAATNQCFDVQVMEGA